MKHSITKLTAGCVALALTFPQPVLAQSDIDFGNDDSEWANDGECDDPRFQGAGMTATPLLDEDIKRDATDCRTAYEAGNLTLRSAGGTTDTSGVDFGNDNSQWANDGECDDPRFHGPGMTRTTLLDDDIMRDATDCRTAYEAGQLTLKTSTPRQPSSSIDFGNNSSEWANDGECDDSRFAGPGMTSTPLLDEDIRGDANDCRAAYEAGQLSLR